MSLPKLTHIAGVFKLEWGPEAITMRVDRLSETSKHEVSAEVTIRTTTPGVPPHLHQARCNLTSTTARRSLANHLTERMSSVDWHGIVEQLCVLVLEKHREGEPVVQLITHQVSEGLSHRVFPYLPENQPTVLFGHGDTGKSYLAAYWGVLICTGTRQNGLIPEPGNVLYLDYETDADTMFERVARISSGLEVGFPDNFHYRYCHQPLVTDLDQIRRHVADKQISFIIIDSAAPAVVEPEASQPTTDYFRGLRSLRVTTLTVAHLAKGGNQNIPFGSIFWRNLPRANYKAFANPDPGADEFVIGIRHIKSNNERRLPDSGFKIKFDTLTTTFERASLSEDPEMAKEMSIKQRLDEALAKGSMTVKELSDQIEVGEGTIRAKLNQYKQVFIRLDQEGTGYWGLREIIHSDVV